MLVLSRRKGEKIIVNETITIEIVEIRGSTVRLGITADKSVPIIRDDAINQERKL